jgi:hypothetical protein
VIRAFHFVGEKLRNGEAIPPNGEWLSVDKSKLKMCEFGLHASEHPFDALNYAPGFTLCLVDIDSKILRQNDKVCAEKRRIVARFDAKELCLKFARDCASDVLHLWNAPQVVKDFLATGENASASASASVSVSAAYASDAAYAAAAVSAAYAAAAAYASAAARAAAKKKYRGWFLERVNEKFKEHL